VNEALYAVGNEEKGTAFPVRDKNLEVAGKTGTAQTGYVNTGADDPKKAWYLSRDHAWFAAYSPAKAPEIAVVVLVEHGGSGPTVAAPIAMQVIRDYHRLQQMRAAKAVASKDGGRDKKPDAKDAPAPKPVAPAVAPAPTPAPDPDPAPPRDDEEKDPP
jgi:penicillin-binding protein 2